MTNGEDFITWLNNELDKLGWNYSELARRSDLTTSGVSVFVTRQRNPTWDFCAKIARALGHSEDAVFRKAGLLPPLPPETAELREADRLMRLIPPERRQLALKILRQFANLP